MKATKGRVWLFSAALAMGYSFALAADTATEHFEAGRKLGEAGDMPAAAREFREALQLNPQFAEAHYLLALTVIAEPSEKLDWPQAASQCQAALETKPDYPEAHHLLGVSLAALGRRDEAIEQFRKALQLRPGYPEAHLDLGMAYAAESRQEAAIAEYRQAIAFRPRYAVAHERLGKSLFDEGKLAEARAEAVKALAMNPDLADTHYLLGRLLLASHQQAEAQIEFRELAQLHSRRELATESIRLSNAGLDAARRGDLPGAIANLKEAVQKKPDSAVAHYNLGLVLADSGNLDAGMAEVTKAVSLAPLQTAMQASLERMRSRSKVSVAQKPQADTPAAHLNSGRVLAQQGDELGAIGEYLRTLALAPDNRDARSALVQAYRAFGDRNNAELESEKLKMMQAGSADK